MELGEVCSLRLLCSLISPEDNKKLIAMAPPDMAHLGLFKEISKKKNTL